MAEICEYVLSLVALRSGCPQPDMISDLLAVNRGEAGASEEDIARVVAGLVSAGTGTSGTACARALRTLFRNPDLLDQLRLHPDLVPAAMEELLRYDSGLLAMPRYALESFTFQDRAFHRGQMVVLCLHSANHDPEVFDRPDRIDFARDNSLALSFGYGAHYCVGSSIARVTLTEMLRAALCVIPRGAQLLEDQVRWSGRGIMGQIKSLPINLGDRQ